MLNCHSKSRRLSAASISLITRSKILNLRALLLTTFLLISDNSRRIFLFENRNRVEAGCLFHNCNVGIRSEQAIVEIARKLLSSGGSGVLLERCRNGLGSQGQFPPPSSHTTGCAVRPPAVHLEHASFWSSSWQFTLGASPAGLNPISRP